MQEHNQQSVAQGGKKAGAKNAGFSHYVVENACSQNARNKPSHYVDENKDSCNALAIMLMKNMGVMRENPSSEGP
jgi:hypothetical protein